MENLYFENGLLYISHRDLILNGRIRGDSLYSLIVDHPFGALDIDSREDFELVEYYYGKYKMSEKQEDLNNIKLLLIYRIFIHCCSICC